MNTTITCEVPILEFSGAEKSQGSFSYLISQRVQDVNMLKVREQCEKYIWFIFMKHSV